MGYHGWYRAPLEGDLLAVDALGAPSAQAITAALGELPGCWSGRSPSRRTGPTYAASGSAFRRDHHGKPSPCSDRAYRAVRLTRTLQAAKVMQQAQRKVGPDPAILLLTHAYFGADEDLLPKLPHLRALFVQYPDQRVIPPFAATCKRWQTVTKNDISDVGALLGTLVG